MEFKGTKGKWVFNETQMKIKGSGDIEGHTVIANVSPKMDFSRGMTTQKANALLISKAPEMLEMLKDIIKQANEVVYVNSMGASETYFQLINQAEQLIKEATEL